MTSKDEYIKIIENHPLTRALRLDKILLSGLIATLQLYLSDKYKEIPLWNILNKKTEDIYKLVVKWKKNLKNDSILQVTKSSTMIGGGSIPEQSVDSYSLEINFEKSSIKADTLNKKLKSRKTPILSRIKDNKLYIDPITILHGQENEVFKASFSR